MFSFTGAVGYGCGERIGIVDCKALVRDNSFLEVTGKEKAVFLVCGFDRCASPGGKARMLPGSHSNSNFFFDYVSGNKVVKVNALNYTPTARTSIPF